MLIYLFTRVDNRGGGLSDYNRRRVGGNGAGLGEARHDGQGVCLVAHGQPGLEPERRLEEKGALCSENVGKVLGYYPLIEREDAAMSETADLIDRVYRGSLSQLVSTFTKRQSLSKEEIDELYAMLRRMEDGHA